MALAVTIVAAAAMILTAAGVLAWTERERRMRRRWLRERRAYWTIMDQTQEEIRRQREAKR
jgi:uncharacterized membrane protein YidH (DUF202 family)